MTSETAGNQPRKPRRSTEFYNSLGALGYLGQILSIIAFVVVWFAATAAAGVIVGAAVGVAGAVLMGIAVRGNGFRKSKNKLELTSTIAVFLSGFICALTAWLTGLWWVGALVGLVLLVGGSIANDKV